jgi:predicted NBD/HSP70 family sugar kinase
MNNINPPLSNYCLPNMHQHSSALNTSKTLVLRIIKDAGVISRKTLAYYTGLTQASITNITSELIESGLVIENGLVEGEHRRRMVGLSIIPDRFCTIGVRVTSQYLVTGIFDINSQCIDLKKTYWDSFADVTATFEELSKEIRSFLTRADQLQLMPIGFGLSLLGAFRLTRDTAIMTDIKGHSRDLQKYLSEEFALPVYTGSPSNCSLYYYACNRDFNYLCDETVVLLTLSYDIDFSVMVNRSAVTGSASFPGSYGATMITDCNGNSLSLWEAISTSNILLKAKRLADSNPDSLLNKYRDNLTFRNLLEIFYSGDPLVKDLFHYMADAIGYTLAQLIHAFHPHRIFIGDEIPISESFHHMVIEATRSHLPVSASSEDFPQIERLCILRETRNDPTLIGATLYATNKIIQDPEWIKQ